LIDRPYTLPKGVAAWKTLLTNGIKNPIPVPLFWEQSINNNLTLEWAPLPVGLRYQILNKDNLMFGARLSLGLLVGQDSPLIIPRISFVNRTKLTQNTALEANLITAVTYKNKSGYKSGLTSYFELGPIFQISDVFAFKPELGIRLASYPDISKTIEETDYIIYKKRLVYPLKLNFDLKFSNQWLLETQYEYQNLVSSGYSLQTVSLTLSHYW